MAEKISGSSKPAKVIRDAAQVIEVNQELLYQPTENEKHMKAEFWVKWQQGPTRSTDKISAAAVSQILGRTTINKTWSLPGFRDWFLNKDEFRQRAEYLSMRAIQTLEELLMPTEKADIRHKAAKTILELGEKFKQKKPEVVVADAKIQKMSSEDLKDYLKDHKEDILALFEESDD